MIYPCVIIGVSSPRPNLHFGRLSLESLSLDPDQTRTNSIKNTISLIFQSARIWVSRTIQSEPVFWTTLIICGALRWPNLRCPYRFLKRLNRVRLYVYISLTWLIDVSYERIYVARDVTHLPFEWFKTATSEMLKRVLFATLRTLPI